MVSSPVKETWSLVPPPPPTPIPSSAERSFFVVTVCGVFFTGIGHRTLFFLFFSFFLFSSSYFFSKRLFGLGLCTFLFCFLFLFFNVDQT